MLIDLDEKEIKLALSGIHIINWAKAQGSLLFNSAKCEALIAKLEKHLPPNMVETKESLAQLPNKDEMREWRRRRAEDVANGD